MKIQLYGIEQAPVSLPIWHTIMDDLGNPPAARVARVLGLSRRSIYRYNRSGYAPRVVLLATFWLTRWGRSAVHTQATNDAILACGYAECLRSRVSELEADLNRVISLGDFGSANAPLIGVRHVP